MGGCSLIIMAYVPNLDPGLIATVKEELAKKESQQRKHYFLFNELKNMAKELPNKYAQRLPYDLLSSLANSLIDGTVFQIVEGLVEIQQMSERNLFNQRVKLINTHRQRRQMLKQKQKGEVETCPATVSSSLLQNKHRHELAEFEKTIEDELKKHDMKLLLEIDQKVSDQQVTLCKAAVPGFYVSNNSHEVRLQMYLLEFIQRLAKIDPPPQ